jgi:hypothetical protein
MKRRRELGHKLLFRLTADPRMRNVWKELYKKRREGGPDDIVFFYKPNLEAVFPRLQLVFSYRHRASKLRRIGGDKNSNLATRLETLANELERIDQTELFRGYNAQKIQDFAIGRFFSAAFDCALTDTSVITAAELKNMRRSLLDVAERLRGEAKTLRTLGLADGHVRSLEDVAHECEVQSVLILPDADSLLVVKRQRGDARARGYLIALGFKTELIFGSHLTTTLATTTNVVFGRSDITAKWVRETLRARGGAAA